MAQNNLGLRHIYGDGVKQDLKKAIKWLKEAVKRGNPEAQYNMGLLYEYGNGVVQDKEKAMILYKKAAERVFRDIMANTEGFW